MRLGFEEGGAGARKEFMRSDSDNWRTLREEQEEEDTGEPGGSWRLTGARRDGNTILLLKCKKVFYFTTS